MLETEEQAGQTESGRQFGAGWGGGESNEGDSAPAAKQGGGEVTVRRIWRWSEDWVMMAGERI
jgi:hypothetical protein